MKYQKGTEVICIRTLKRKDDGQINFIKGETYIIEDTFQKQPFKNNPAYKPVYIVLRNIQGSLQTVKGANKTKYFKLKQGVTRAVGF
jgi:hypothetical protein